MRVCQYLSNNHPFYLQMVSNSVSMLRRHNETIKIRLILVEDEGNLTKTTNHNADSLPKTKYCSEWYVNLIKSLNVEVINKKPIKLQGEEGFFHINRSLLNETQEDSLLFIDADTFIFRNVEELFDKYSHYDYVGLPITFLDGWDKSWLPFKPFNSAVNLWNNGWIREFANTLPYYCRLLRERKTNIAEWCYSKCLLGTNREEISTSMFVADNKLKNKVWERNDVLNSASFNDYEFATNSCIFHTFTHNWRRAKGLYFGKKPKFKLLLI